MHTPYYEDSLVGENNVDQNNNCTEIRHIATQLSTTLATNENDHPIVP